MSKELVRLEREDRSFWEVTRTGTTVVTRFGKYLSAGRKIEKKFDDVPHAKHAMEKMIADKRADGYGEPAVKVAPGAGSVKGVSVRNADLEAIIDAAPDDPQGYLVYADWLQQQGDVRGELIVVQHGRSLDPDDAALERGESGLLERFEDELFGDLTKYKQSRNSFRSVRGLSWKWGFLHGARLRHKYDTPISNAVRKVLAHPSGRFLRKLVIGRPAWESNSDPDFEILVGVLAKQAPPTLDTIVIGDGYGEVVIDALWTALPHLRTLVLAGGSSSPRLRTVRADALEELVVTFASHDEIAELSKAQWPKLRKLSIAVTVPTASIEGALAPFFASTGFPALTHLSMQRWLTSSSDTLVPHDTLALEILRFAAGRKLARLDLLTPITEAGARAIADEPSLSAIGAITMPMEAIKVPDARTAIERRHRNFQWTAEIVELEDLERLAD